MNLEQSRYNMIEQQIRPWNVLDQTVLDLLERLPRDAFVDDAWKKLAYADIEIPIGQGEAMMFPRVEARMLQALAIKPEDTCLEIGTGSGYITACLATLGKEVYSVERHESLTQNAEQRLTAQGIRNAKLLTSNVVTDWDEGVTLYGATLYDVIAITASMPTYNSVYEKMLKPGGRLFVVMDKDPTMYATLIKRSAQGDISRSTLFETSLKAMTGYTEDAVFRF